MSQPLVSIVIPTRNRADYAVPAVQSLLRMPEPTLQVVVSDNSDDDSTAEGLAAWMDDPRLTYLRLPGRITLSENFESGCRAARGEYLGCIGDDDGVNPVAMAVARWALDGDLDAVAAPVVADYGWPDFLRRYYGGASAAVLRIRPFGGSVSFPAVDAEMRKMLRAGGQDLACLPRIYYGLVRRRCFEAVWATHGACFPGVSPDMAGAVALSSQVQRFAWLDYPLFLPGSSRKSGAGQSALKQHVGRMEDQTHMGGATLVWPDRVPRFYAVQTVWAASVFTALTATGRDRLAVDFNDARLHAMCAVFNPSYARTTWEHLKALQARRVGNTATTAFVWHYLETWGTRVRSLVTRAWGSATGKQSGTLHRDLADIGAAVDRLTAVIDADTRRMLERLRASGAAPRP